jgi:hypothetical protein
MPAGVSDVAILYGRSCDVITDGTAPSAMTHCRAVIAVGVVQAVVVLGDDALSDRAPEGGGGAQLSRWRAGRR